MTQVIQSLINVLNSPIAQRQGIILSPEHCREWADALSEALRSGVGLIAEERQRQIEKGFTQEHDANHEVCDYVVAANCYSVAANVSYSTEFFRTEEEKLILESIRREWPWDKEDAMYMNVVTNCVHTLQHLLRLVGIQKEIEL